jgi:mono/diheme cytochrome c family protein
MAFQIGWRRTGLVLSSLFLVVIAGWGLLSCSGKKSKDQYPVSATPGGPVDAVLLKKLFDVKCALCHGSDGKQQYAGAKNLGESTLVRDEIVNRIREGKGAMPSQKDVLSDEQINALADYVLALR